MTGAIAKRYARALAGVAGEQNRLEQTAWLPGSTIRT